MERKQGGNDFFLNCVGKKVKLNDVDTNVVKTYFTYADVTNFFFLSQLGLNKCILMLVGVYNANPRRRCSLLITIIIIF